VVGVCEGEFCPSCLDSYFAERVSTSRFALLPMTCAGCRQRIPTDSWRACVEETTFKRYEQNTRDLLQLRCPDCDSLTSLWQPCYSDGLEKAMQCFLARCRDADDVRQAWSSFEEGLIGPNHFLEVLCRSGPPDLQDVQPELRVGETGGAYSQAQFIEWYDGKLGRCSVDDYMHGRKAVSEEWHEVNDGHGDCQTCTPTVNGCCSECAVCGCTSEFDIFGDRICWCDSCQLVGCTYSDMELDGGACVTCGCSTEVDDFGDRVCWCDSCQLIGCTYREMELDGGACVTCGCSSEFDKLGDRVCWCDSCQLGGCVHLTGLRMWDNATLWQASKRRNQDCWQFSLAECEFWYGQAQGRQMWEDMPINNIGQVLLLLTDVDRRTTLHLAHLRKWPHIYTPCCETDYCFRCQKEWHSNQTCDEIMRLATTDVQSCPCCQVPTQRTEGCSSMVCLCGEEWKWKGGEDYSDDE